MDAKVEIKEEDSLCDDLVLQNERDFFTKNETVKKSSDAVLLDSDHYVTVKPEIKLVSPFSELYTETERKCSRKHLIKQIKPEDVIHRNNSVIDIKIETASQNEDFLTEDPVVKIKEYNSDHEMDYKIDVKEEPFWLETETFSTYDDIKDRDFTAVKSPRLCRGVSGDSSVLTPLSSAESSGKDTNFGQGKNYLECESQESDITKTLTVQSVSTEICTEHSNGGESYSRALLMDKDQSSYDCNICDKSFSHLSALKLHNSIHKGAKPLKCEVREKSYTNLSTLNLHNLKHESIKPHKCEICEKSFISLSSLKMHNLIHEGKKPHKCKICNKSFTQLITLKQHKLIHEDEKPHRCDICEKSFTRLSSLKYHNLMHEGEKPHKCDICNKSFSLLASLKRHNLTHESKKPHKCDICNQSFARLTSLKRHNWIHEDKKPHKCEVCEKSFTELCSLKVHNLKHKGVKPHKCKICEDSFSWLSSFKRHLLKHEGKKIHKCEICDKRFTLLSYLKKHMLIH